VQVHKDLRSYLSSLSLGVSISVLPRQDKAAIEDGLARLVRVCQVRSLNLSTLVGYERGDGVKFEHVSHAVKWCTGLVRLDLQLQLKSELGIQHLRDVLQECTALRELNLAKNHFFDSDVKMLTAALAGTPITSLDLGYNRIWQRGSEELGQFLATCSTLEELHLSHNLLGKKGVGSLVPALQTSSSTLRKVSLKNADMGDGGAKAFAQVLDKLKALEEIDVEWNHIEEEGMTALLNMLPYVKRLRILNISDNEVGPAVALLGDVLQACPELSDLRMNSIDLRDAGAESIEAAWRSHTQLTRLELRSNKLDMRGIKSIARSLLRYGKLRVLDLSKNDSHEEPAWASMRDCLAQLTELQHLALRECGLRKSTMQTMALGVANLKKLKCLRLDDNFLCTESTTTLGDALGQCTSLVELGLQRVRLGPEEMRILAQKLVLCTLLERLHLAENDIGTAGVEHLACVLRKCNRLRELDISENGMHNTAVSALFHDQCNCTALQKLNVSKNKLGAEGMQTLTPMLAQLPALTSLDLFICEIGCDGAEALAAGLSQCPPLRSLNLSSNRIKVEAAMQLVQALRLCSSLQRLCIRGNEMHREAADALVQHAPPGLLVHV